MRVLKKIGWGVLALLLVVTIVVADFLRHGGQFRTLEPHFAGTCESVPLSVSAEDIQIDRAANVAYLSALDRRGQVEGKDVRGTVLRIDLKVQPLTATPALVADPPDFRPHGMSLHAAPDGAQRLFVLSHPPGQPHTVEIFERNAEGRFAHVQTVRSPLLVKPNAIAAVSPTQFYVANDSGARSRMERVMEMLFRRKLASLVYFEKGRTANVGPKIASGTGMAASADGRRVYVSESNRHKVLFFERGLTSGDLRLRDEVDVGSHADNLNVAADGAIWVTSHPKVMALARQFGDASKVSPTQIVRVDPDPAARERVQEIYLNLGEEMSAGSVAATYTDAQGDAMLVGSITARKVLACRLPASAAT
jgi:arylesterase / paraoxonase